MSIDFSSWTEATANLSWGAQNVIHTALELAKDGQVKIVYGADYYDGSACLVNTVGQMLEVGGGSGIPMHHFGAMVGEFDRLNAEFARQGVNSDWRTMSPLAAEILLQHFGPLKDQPVATEICQYTNTPINKCLCTIHDPEGYHFRATRPNMDQPVDQELPGHREIIPEVSDEDFAASWLAAVSTDAVVEDEIREVLDPVKEQDLNELAPVDVTLYFDSKSDA